MPLQATSGAASYDAFGGGVPVVPNYIEDVFSTYLWTSVANTQYNISNGIDLSTKGGMSWLKARNAALNNALFDTVRGAGNFVSSNNTNAESTGSTLLSSFNTDGFSGTAGAAYNYVGWTFRKQPKFFDIVTYTGTGTGNRSISHNLGSTPGCMIVKVTSFTDPWAVYHRSLTTARYLLELNTTSGEQDGGTAWWGNTAPTSTTFMVGTENNKSGQTYVAYLFAHDAGGFGLTGTDNVISCGSFTTDGSGNATVSLGYEPQWVLIKKSSAAGDWLLQDTMREMSQTNLRMLSPNTSDAENNFGAPYVVPTATGFNIINSYIGTGATGVYIAIRRGPMKVPTVGTSVFSPNTTSDDGNAITVGFPADMFIEGNRAGSTINQTIMDRLRGNGLTLITSSTAAQDTTGEGGFASNTSVKPGLFGGTANAVVWTFRRAPSFFDEVCYTGDGATRTINHNLGVAPELMIVKRRDAASQWTVYSSSIASTYVLNLNNTNAAGANASIFTATAPTSSVFSLGTSIGVNADGGTFVNYLFATCAGVSKVGSYTGTATTKQIDCGFTAGARFVLIKRTDSTGDWYVWDSARGIVSGNDPYLLLNTTGAEVTSTDYIDTYSAGFEISSTAPAAINGSGGTFIFLAIA